ncbi:2-oxoglutarate and iron-dependent oxygenase domain-containing protein 2 isoform X2 [Rhinoderma darwinii]
MNNYGVLLNELGLDESFITPLREKYLRPIASIIYPDWGGGYLDSHKAFVVQYSEDKDLDLSCHYDNSEVTLNVSLGKAFTDGNLYFSDMREFCTDFVAELENFEKSQLDKGRPNTMNNYGVLLNELGLDESFITPLREKYLRPITSIIYPDWGGGYLDSHKAFVVQYSEDKDLDLSCHYDNSEVTLNVSLGKAFTDGNLYFSDMREVPSNERRYTEVEHTIGRGILHRGQQVHGALPITSGERWNLIIWMRASSIRNKQCPMCHKEPQLVETMGEGDGFTVIRKEDRGEAVNVCTLI